MNYIDPMDSLLVRLAAHTDAMKRAYERTKYDPNPSQVEDLLALAAELEKGLTERGYHVALTVERRSN